MKMIENFRLDSLFVASLFFFAIILFTRRSVSEQLENIYLSPRLEYGGVLKQEWKYRDNDEIDLHLSTVIKCENFPFLEIVTTGEFTKKFIANRFPNSIPQSDKFDQVDFVVKDVRKKSLIYAPNDLYPVYIETQHMDNRGTFYKMTSLFILGVTYHLHLLWKKRNLEYIHNITISCYPTDKIHMFSHTFFVQHSNKSLLKSEELLFHKGLFSPKVTLGGLDLHENEISLQSFKYNPQRSNGIDHTTLDDQSGKSRYCHSDNEDCTDNEYDSSENIYRRGANPTFSVMSYNIWNMNSLSGKSTDYVQRMKGIQKIVKAASPDIVGFQEVRYEDSKGGDMGPNQVGTLADLLPGYQFVFQPAQMQPNSIRDGRTEEGVAIFSRYPIISHDFIFLFRNKSNSADTHQRICLHAEIMIPQFGKVHVFVTHLSLSHEAREESVIQIWQYMKQFEGPAILLGDLNAEPEEITVQYLRGKPVFDGEDPPILTDLWLHHNHGRQLGYTYSALEITLSKQIDYIFFKHGLGCCEVLLCDTLDDGKRGSEAASDHLPLISTLALPGQNGYQQDSLGYQPVTLDQQNSSSHAWIKYSLVKLSERFMTLIQSERTALKDEIQDHILTPKEELHKFDRDSTSLEQFWQTVGNLTLPTGRKQFKLLGELSRVVLTYPHSNADTERTFSILRKIQVDFRGNLDPVTVHNLLSVKMNNDKGLPPI